MISIGKIQNNYTLMNYMCEAYQIQLSSASNVNYNHTIQTALSLAVVLDFAFIDSLQELHPLPLLRALKVYQNLMLCHVVV